MKNKKLNKRDLKIERNKIKQSNGIYKKMFNGIESNILTYQYGVNDEYPKESKY